MRRRGFLALTLAGTRLPAQAGTWAPVVPGTALRFPRDHGAHADFRTEWWYVTGWLQRPGAADAGFQLTFFRSRTGHSQDNPSRFAPRQLVLGHAALALPERSGLLHDQRAARAGLGLAMAESDDTHVWIGLGDDAWRIRRDPATYRYRASLTAREFALAIELAPDGPPVPQGIDGVSRKGEQPQQASHYYSRPQLTVSGTLTVAGRSGPIAGRAWFDHEWSSDMLDARAGGWDWVGLNLDDGAALMAFRIRDRSGGELWRDASLRSPQGTVSRGLAPRFEPRRTWQSARTGARYPVAMRLQVGGRDLELRPLIDDQELDARASTGIVYWEGAVTAFEDGRRVGRGYLELTGYAGAVRL